MRNFRTLSIVLKIYIAIAAMVWSVTGFRAGLYSPGEWLRADPALVLAFVATGGIVVGLSMLYSIWRAKLSLTPSDELGVDGFAELIEDVRRRESHDRL